MKLVKEIMTPDPCCIRPDTPLRSAATEMKERSIGCLPVVDGDRVVGMLTDRDIVIRAVAGDREPGRLTASEAMTTQPVTIRDDRTIDEAASMMKRREIRRLVAVDEDGRPVGVLSLGDLAACRDDQDTTLAANDVFGKVCAAS